MWFGEPAMTTVKVLVVDDSALSRKLISDALTDEGEAEVVAAASNGRLALERLRQGPVDIVTLDLEMPEMDGLATLKAIREQYPKLPVIMVSAYTEKGAKQTFDALSLGANDYITKPQSQKDFEAARLKVKQELLTKIRALVNLGACSTSQKKSSPIPLQAASRSYAKVQVVAIGSSTGGPNALADLLSAFPLDFNLPILVTQHMPPMFTRMLAERLNQICALPVVEATDGQKIEAGNVYLAPGGFHMLVKRSNAEHHISLTEDPPENCCRPAVDPMFRSIVSSFGSGTLGVILTGMGQDGLEGCRVIRANGGQVVVQNEETSVVWGMPGVVAQSGLADIILPINSISAEILSRVNYVKDRKSE